MVAPPGLFTSPYAASKFRKFMAESQIRRVNTIYGMVLLFAGCDRVGGPCFPVLLGCRGTPFPRLADCFRLHTGCALASVILKLRIIISDLRPVTAGRSVGAHNQPNHPQ
jgi:hypothetical protein